MNEFELLITIILIFVSAAFHKLALRFQTPKTLSSKHKQVIYASVCLYVCALIEHKSFLSSRVSQ